jgi:hypothetical protein
MYAKVCTRKDGIRIISMIKGNITKKGGRRRGSYK